MRRIAVALMLATVPFAAHAETEQQAEIRAACLLNTNWTEAACVCIAEKAHDDLSPDQQAFLAISLRGDKDAAKTQVAKLSAPELLETTMYMMKQGPACQ